jgi:hypothetical protein
MVGQGYTAAFAPRFPGKAISKYLDYRENSISSASNLSDLSR